MESDGSEIMGLTWADNTVEVFTTATGTISFNDNDTQKLFIDWGDGEVVDIEQGVYQWDDVDATDGSISLTHIYTKTGSFAPVLRTVNSNGFVSKYFGSGASSSYSPYESVSTLIHPISVSDGAPTGVNKVENKTVLSGIDNSIFKEGPKDVFISVPPVLSKSQLGYVVSGLSGRTAGQYDIILKIDAQIATPVDFDSTAKDMGGKQLITETITKTINLNTALSGFKKSEVLINESNYPITKILKITLQTANLKSTYNPSNVSIDEVYDSFNKLKFLLWASGSSDGLPYPITYVSSGDPIKSISDTKRNAYLDFSQSRSKASNTSIKEYIYDNGKAWFNPVNQWQASTSTGLDSNTIASSSANPFNLQYTYMPRPDGLAGNPSFKFLSSGAQWWYNAASPQTEIRNQFIEDDYNRFFDQYHLTRVESKSSSNYFSTLDGFDGVYRITPTRLPASATPGLNWVIDDGPPSNPTHTRVLTSGAWYNLSSNAVLSGSSKWNSGSFLDAGGNKRKASEYFILISDKKHNKIFLNCTPYGGDLAQASGTALYDNEEGVTALSGTKITSVSYLHADNEVRGNPSTLKAEWRPVYFDDTTSISKEYRNTSRDDGGDQDTYTTRRQSLAKSGYVSFDIPHDWSAVTLSGMAGGSFNINEPAGISFGRAYRPPPLNDSEVTTFYEASGTCGDGLGGKYFTLTGATGQIPSYMTADLMGNSKYIIHVTGPDLVATNTDINKVFWLSSGSGLGYEPGAGGGGSDRFIITGRQFSDLQAEVGKTTDVGELHFNIRRVNIYNVFDGIRNTNVNRNVPGFDDVKDSETERYRFKWMFSGTTASGNNVLSDLTTRWATTDMYALKIGLDRVTTSGSGDSVSGSKEVWDILPFNNQSSQVIIQRDNNAYDLRAFQITSDIRMNYAGTFYQAISKGGTVFIVRTGTPIQNITFSSKAFGDESSFKYNMPYTSYGTLRKLRLIQSNMIRVMWDETQKDGTSVRFFGFIKNVAETHRQGGPRAPRNFTSQMVVEEICLLDKHGRLMTDTFPLGGIEDERSFF